VTLATALGRVLGDGGSIAFVLSTSVRAPIPGLAISNGLRPGLAMVAKSLADELGPRGIRVNGILPGSVETERTRELDSLRGDPVAAKAAAVETIPLRRYGTPEEFGRTAAFLLSPAASYITGTMVTVDGGVTRSF
jgi:3-oxoacyl-[acyl-carrier protein] reductase